MQKQNQPPFSSDDQPLEEWPQRTVVVVQNPKHLVLALILTFFFGPLGMLYSTTKGAITMFLVNLIFGFLTLGFVLVVAWPIQMVWSAIAVNKYNAELNQQRIL